MCTAEAHSVGAHCVNRTGLLLGQEKQNITRLTRERGVCKALPLWQSAAALWSKDSSAPEIPSHCRESPAASEQELLLQMGWKARGQLLSGSRGFEVSKPRRHHSFLLTIALLTRPSWGPATGCLEKGNAVYTQGGVLFSHRQRKSHHFQESIGNQRCRCAK